MDKNPYETRADEYESWFHENDLLFQSELEAIKQLMPDFRKGIEIGAGTGIFAQALGVREGVEPSAAMRKKSEARGIRVIDASAEKLPIADAVHDLVLMITVDCFLKNVRQAFEEIHRIMTSDGYLVIAFLDRSSPLGVVYETRKKNNPFYAAANLHSSAEIKKELAEAGFEILHTCQTIYELENKKQIVLPGSGKGVFVVFQARKITSKK